MLQGSLVVRRGFNLANDLLRVVVIRNELETG